MKITILSSFLLVTSCSASIMYIPKNPSYNEQKSPEPYNTPYPDPPHSLDNYPKANLEDDPYAEAHPRAYPKDNDYADGHPQKDDYPENHPNDGDYSEHQPAKDDYPETQPVKDDYQSVSNPSKYQRSYDGLPKDHYQPDYSPMKSDHGSKAVHEEYTPPGDSVEQYPGGHPGDKVKPQSYSQSDKNEDDYSPTHSIPEHPSQPGVGSDYQPPVHDDKPADYVEPNPDEHKQPGQADDYVPTSGEGNSRGKYEHKGEGGATDEYKDGKKQEYKQPSRTDDYAPATGEHKSKEEYKAEGENKGTDGYKGGKQHEEYGPEGQSQHPKAGGYSP